MNSLGSSLKIAREQKNLSISQVAEMTRLSFSMIEAIEKDDFSLIPAAIYGRSFIKLIAQAVGLDPQPLVDLFSTIYQNPGANPYAPSSAPPLAKGAEEPLSPTEPPSPVEPIASEPPPSVRLTSRYAAPQPLDDRPSVLDSTGHLFGAVPSQVWRLLALAIAALAILAILILGIRSLYNATTSALPDADPEIAATVDSDEPGGQDPAPSTPAEAPSMVKPRRGTVNEPLYID